MELREMRAEDVPAVLELSSRSFGEMAWNERDFYHAMDNAYDFCYVISEAESVLGYAILRKLGPEAEVQEICIAEGFRKRGLGERLMEELLKKARELRGEKVFLEVREGNFPARRLYEKKGFQSQYKRKDYYTAPIEDALIMCLPL